MLGEEQIVGVLKEVRREFHEGPLPPDRYQ